MDGSKGKRGDDTRRAVFIILVDFDFRWGRGGGECVCGGGWGGKETEVDASKVFYLRANSTVTSNLSGVHACIESGSPIAA